MKNNIYINQLMIPIWPLYNVEVIENVKFNAKSANSFKKGYSLKRRLDIYKALDWAANKPNYDFISIMKDAPNTRKIEFNNNKIHEHLMAFKSFMEKEEFFLLV